MAYMCVQQSGRECDGCGNCKEHDPNVFCQKCGVSIYGDVYQDIDYEQLCIDCLEELHKKASEHRPK